MFYSETLLSKTGPLARVWLSANIERKLTKSHILQSDIEGSVNAIVDQGQAPMALRLSGQLLLGVVRIYSRKARYLLDDCNEALMKIKMVDEFLETVELLLADFPLLNNWLEWWVRKPHAKMIFPACVSMEPQLWDHLPTTTNAQESLHFQLYSAAGKKHQFFEGMKALYRWAIVLEDDFKSKQSTFLLD